ncbi:hypothetical protein UFOVP1229_158 [uncultured Caudovirales phage]|uniref:Uncharacterized protein n=1 Tax=uncultured Caudovirales phage TaxID=2100421 RepID=A0A6J5RJ67_9CAUD|nr:hypothetical protein UFOVP1229_158 [uncultured Caudovirales phage]
MTFMRPGDIDIETILTTCDMPVSRAVDVGITGDYNLVAIDVPMGANSTAGVCFSIDDTDGLLTLEIHHGEDSVFTFKLVDRAWKQRETE